MAHPVETVPNEVDLLDDDDDDDLIPDLFPPPDIVYPVDPIQLSGYIYGLMDREGCVYFSRIE